MAQGKGVAICDSALEANAVAYEAGLLTKSEKEALKSLVEFGSVKEASKKIPKGQSTLKKQLKSARKKLKANTNFQAILIAYKLRLIQ